MFFSISLFAQNTEFKVVSYNLLTFPTQGGPDTRFNDLEKILDHCQPDLFFVQELLSEIGLRDITSKCNELFDDEYAHGKFIGQISNPSNSWKLQQNLVFNDDKFDLVDQETIVTTHRDHNYFKLLVNDPNLSPADSTFLHIYVVHLKSSNSPEHEQTRLQMVNKLFEHLEDLPENSNIMVGGDFNIYDSDETPYVKLLSDNGSNTLKDPINKPNWYSHNDILTQSTRTSPPAGSGGAGGGVDDRFDFVLLSEALMDAEDKFAYIHDSYKALGNDGTCYNQNITDCGTNNEVSSSLLSALYNMSDHLPVVLSIGNKTVSSMEEISEIQPISIYPNPTNHYLNLELNDLSESTIKVINAMGQTIVDNKIYSNKERLDIQNLPNGIYIIRIKSKSISNPITKRFVKF